MATHAPISLTTSYQTGFSATTDSRNARAVLVQPNGNDVYAQVTYYGGATQIFAIDDGKDLPVAGDREGQNPSIVLVEVKARVSAGGTCNVSVIQYQ